MRSVAWTLPAVVVVACLLGCAGCATIDTRSTWNPDAEFDAYETFALAPPPANPPSGLPRFGDLQIQRIQGAIAGELETRGLTRLDEPVAADLTVAFSLDGQPRTDVWSMGARWSNDIHTTHYVETTLLIEIFDNATQRAVWEGYGARELYGRSGDPARIESDVRAILAKFPPGHEKR